MRGTWSLSLFRRYRPHLTVGSMLRLRTALMAGGAGRLGEQETIAVRLRHAGSTALVLRPGSSDLGTFDEVFVGGVYDGVVRHAPETGTIIDLGANIGLASLFFLLRFPRARLLAIEPAPDNFALLTRNLAPFSARGCAVTRRAALWGADQPVTFSTAAAGRFDSGTIGEQPDAAASDAAEAEVPGMSMPAILAHAGFDTVDLLKVDVEGAERHLFAGGDEWLDRVGCLAVEFHGTARAECGFDAVVARHGFRLVEQNPHTTLAVRDGRPR